MKSAQLFFCMLICVGILALTSCGSDDNVEMTNTNGGNSGGNNSGGTSCQNDNSTDQENHSCSISHSSDGLTRTTQYSETIVNGKRKIQTNGVPNHDYRIQIPDKVSRLNDNVKSYEVTTTPSVAGTKISVVNSNNTPAYAFGVALNGVKIDPAPGPPFIFTDSNGEFNWDWVFEPTNNMKAVGLDCAIAHVQPSGEYHYHGDFSIYADIKTAGLGSGNTKPTSADQAFIGWAADGFPILYKYGPTANGTGMELLTPGYQLRSGDRPGDGNSEPCGPYNGKFTRDYEFKSSVGDLDECNGIARAVTITTAGKGGTETFNYFYVVTEKFPVLPRCFSGTPDAAFKIGR